MGRKAKVCIRNPQPKLDEVKVYLCHRVKAACRKHNWNQELAAIYLGTTRFRMHLVDRVKIDQLTVCFLFRLLASAEPHFEILISMDLPSPDRKWDRGPKNLNEV